MVKSRILGDRIEKRFTPIAEGVVVQIIPQNQSAGGIALMDGLKTSNSYVTPMGWVVAIGPDVKQIKVSNKVLLGNYPMMVIVYSGVEQGELVVTTENHIVGIVDMIDGKHSL